MAGDASSFYFDGTHIDPSLHYVLEFDVTSTGKIVKYYGNTANSDVLSVPNFVFNRIDIQGDLGFATAYSFGSAPGSIELRIYKTSNAGAGWSLVHTLTNQDTEFYDIVRVDTTTAYILKGDGFVKTTDSGTNWATVSSPTSATLRSASYTPLEMYDDAAFFARIEETPAPS